MLRSPKDLSDFRNQLRGHPFVTVEVEGPLIRDPKVAQRSRLLLGPTRRVLALDNPRAARNCYCRSVIAPSGFDNDDFRGPPHATECPEQIAALVQNGKHRCHGERARLEIGREGGR
jgi:hypothetical protein